MRCTCPGRTPTSRRYGASASTHPPWSSMHQVRVCKDSCAHALACRAATMQLAGMLEPCRMLGNHHSVLADPSPCIAQQTLPPGCCLSMSTTVSASAGINCLRVHVLHICLRLTRASSACIVASKHHTPMPEKADAPNRQAHLPLGRILQQDTACICKCRTYASWFQSCKLNYR